MAKYDLAGNPMPEPTPASPSGMSPSALPGAAPPAVKYDLSGNPIPPAAPPPGPVTGGPAFAPLNPGQPYAPAGGSPYSARPTRAAVNEGGGKRGLWLGLGGAVVIVLGIAAFLLAPKHGAAPTGWTAFTAADKSFSCAAPGGWEVTPSDKAQQMMGKDSTTGGVLFKSGSASIDVTTDTVATLRSYILMHGDGDTTALTGPKAESLHKQWKIATSAIHKGYHETKVADFESSTGDARLSEWTADGNVFGLGGHVHGYRASMVGGDLTAVVVCQCLDSDWPTLKPAFQHVIASVTPPAPPPDAPGSVGGVEMPPMAPMGQ